MALFQEYVLCLRTSDVCMEPPAHERLHKVSPACTHFPVRNGLVNQVEFLQLITKKRTNEIARSVIISSTRTSSNAVYGVRASVLLTGWKDTRFSFLKWFPHLVHVVLPTECPLVLHIFLNMCVVQKLQTRPTPSLGTDSLRICF